MPIFISAQPDDRYFIWQLEIQIRNFHSLGISKDQIHIIVGYHNIIGLKKEFIEFIENNKDYASFFTYPDTRKCPQYISSIRPHLLTKHWQKYPWLKNKEIFYHDSDIILSRIPSIMQLSDNINYVSDTRSYLDSSYIIDNSNKSILKKMAAIVGIDFRLISDNDTDAGGAQYLLKNINLKFWKKVYTDAESLFLLLDNFIIHEKQKKLFDPNHKTKDIKPWYADMWAILWNLWYFNMVVKIHPEIDFSFPTDDIKYWKKNSIIHYSGDHTDRKDFFYKRDYTYYPPWYDENLESIQEANCSYPIVELIKQRKKELDTFRIDLKKFNLLIRSTNNKIVINYIKKYFNINVVYTEPSFQMEKALDFASDLIIPDYLLLKIYTAIELENYTTICFKKVYKVDALFTEIFSKMLDFKLFGLNKGKFNLHHPIQISILNITTEKVLEIDEEVFIL
ncbi:hypothetical protein C8D70_108123 [Chryseobacterium sp. CBTAP 102]|uniref:hypothetical protein n=1 Tax=unclassified Chryseobacterium TaxID=2593645 RepID=UPI00095731F1|nr:MULTISPECIES: hypothetical protein [unclassified Chryseobacterium]PXW13718.1 hypothetical protein C8D70_108123 [Chryseobacterium sp. CBTAP 102]SIQ57077.1 hypothetical protein SAMN05880573_10743 [Chryseobacterium sp. RU33C]